MYVTRHAHTLFVAGTAAVLLLVAAPAMAQINWTNANGGSYGTGSNWGGATVPAPTDDVIFNLSDPGYTVTFGQSRTADFLQFGNDTLTFDLGGNTYTTTYAFVGVNSGNIANLTVSNGTMVTNETVVIGAFSSAKGKVTLTGPAANWNFKGLGVGVFGQGTLNIENGAQISGDVLSLGDNGSTINVSGTGSSIVVTNNALFGEGGNTTLNITGGGTVNTATTSFASNLGTFTATIDGAGSMWTVNDNLTVGVKGDGVLNLTNNGVLATSGMTSIAQTGVINLNGGTLRTTELQLNGGQFNWTNGTLNITSAQGVNLGQSDLFPTATTLSTGQTLDVEQTLTIDSGDFLLLDGGQAQAGTLALSGGYVVGTTLDLDGTGSLTGSGTVAAPVVGSTTATNINATGTLSLGDAGSNNGFDFAGTINVGSHQVILNDADRAQLGVQTNLAAGGRLAAVNGFDLATGNILSATGNASVDGDFTNNGFVNGPSSGLLTFTDDVNGAGNYTGNILFSDGFSPGNSPAQVSFGNLMFDATTSLKIELAGLTPGTAFDQLLIGGNATLGNAALIVDLINGYAPTIGNTFEILDVSGTRFGRFAGLGEGAIFRADGQDFSITYTGGDGNDVFLTSINPAPVPEPSPFALLLVAGGLVVVRRIFQRRPIACTVS